MIVFVGRVVRRNGDVAMRCGSAQALKTGTCADLRLQSGDGNCVTFFRESAIGTSVWFGVLLFAGWSWCRGAARIGLNVVKIV